jgi:hypothetical protein
MRVSWFVVCGIGLAALACGGGGPPQPMSTPADVAASCTDLLAAGADVYGPAVVGKRVLVSGKVKTAYFAGEVTLDGGEGSCLLKFMKAEYADTAAVGSQASWDCKGAAWLAGPLLEECMIPMPGATPPPANLAPPEDPSKAGKGKAKSDEPGEGKAGKGKKAG